jgi:hypothetical protein
LYTWDDQGNRQTIESTFEPYVYLETNNAPDVMSIFNTKLKKKKFKNQSDRSRYLKDNGIVRVFENMNVQQQFLIDTFWQDNEKDDFSRHPLKLYFVDMMSKGEFGFSGTTFDNDLVIII